jgi:hypothetical protein
MKGEVTAYSQPTLTGSLWSLGPEGFPTLPSLGAEQGGVVRDAGPLGRNNFDGKGRQTWPFISGQLLIKKT